MKTKRNQQILLGIAGLAIIAFIGGLVVAYRPKPTASPAELAFRQTATAQAGPILARASEPDPARIQKIQLIRQEDFSQNRLGLLEGHIKNMTGRLETGTYHLLFQGSGERVNLLPPPISSFVSEVDCRVASPDGMCGFIFVSTNDTPVEGQNIPPLQAFFITGKGYGHRYVTAKGAATDITPAGGEYQADEFNRLRVVRLDQVAYFYVNGVEVQRAMFPGPDMDMVLMGLLFGQSGKGEANIWVDNLTIWTLP